jgi:hypothetical protein
MYRWWTFIIIIDDTILQRGHRHYIGGVVNDDDATLPFPCSTPETGPEQ